jgi:hypothetical protein
MKALLFSILFAFTLSYTHAQKAMTFGEAETSGNSIHRLDSLHKSALDADSTKAVFGNKKNEFINTYFQLLKDLNGYLHEYGFTWEQETRCFNRVYFNADGSIGYFLYNFKKGAIAPEKEKQFNTLLNEFIKTYRFPLRAPVKFAQCSPTVYND